MTISSPAGHWHFANKGLGSCGTVRANRRGLPILLKQFAKANKATMQRSSPLFLQSGNMLAIGWYDKRAVCLLTNIHASSMVTKQRHGQPDFQKPTAIEAYNQKMGGVDLADQFNSYYALTKRSYKWWKKVFMHLLLTSVTNAYILHRSSEAELLTSSDFRLQLAEELVEGYERRNVMRGRPSSSEENPYDYLADTSYSIVGSRSQNVLCVPRGKAESQWISNAHRIIARRVYHLWLCALYHVLKSTMQGETTVLFMSNNCKWPWMYSCSLFFQLPLRLFAYQIYVNNTCLPGAVSLWLISTDSLDMTAPQWWSLVAWHVYNF